MVQSGQARRIEHQVLPVVPSPSGLPTQHLVSQTIGSQSLFLGQQWLQPGDDVFLHTHEVEEVLTFLAGEGEAALAGETVPIGVNTSLYIPPGVVHGFRATGQEPLHVLVMFPVPYFAETTFVTERGPDEA